MHYRQGLFVVLSQEADARTTAIHNILTYNKIQGNNVRTPHVLSPLPGDVRRQNASQSIY